MSDAQLVPAIVILGQGALDTARRVQARYPGALVHGLAGRVEADRSYTDFGDTLRELYCAGRPIVALCAAGIVIRSLAPLLQRKGAEPPVLALAEDGSAVVPLLGGLAGVNRLAREIGEVLAVAPAITTSGELRFGTCVLNPPAGYVLADLEQGKRFVADLLGGQPVRVEGAAPIRACRPPPMRSAYRCASCRRPIPLRACARPCPPPSRSATDWRWPPRPWRWTASASVAADSQ